MRRRGLAAVCGRTTARRRQRKRHAAGFGELGTDGEAAQLGKPPPHGEPGRPRRDGRPRCTVWRAGAPSGTISRRTGGLPSCGQCKCLRADPQGQPLLPRAAVPFSRANLPARYRAARPKARSASARTAAARSSCVRSVIGTLLSPCKDSEGAAHVRVGDGSKRMFVGQAGPEVWRGRSLLRPFRRGRQLRRKRACVARNAGCEFVPARHMAAARDSPAQNRRSAACAVDARKSSRRPARPCWRKTRAVAASGNSQPALLATGGRFRVSWAEEPGGRGA